MELYDITKPTIENRICSCSKYYFLNLVSDYIKQDEISIDNFYKRHSELIQANNNIIKTTLIVINKMEGFIRQAIRFKDTS